MKHLMQNTVGVMDITNFYAYGHPVVTKNTPSGANICDLLISNTTSKSVTVDSLWQYQCNAYKVNCICLRFVIIARCDKLAVLPQWFHVNNHIENEKYNAFLSSKNSTVSSPQPSPIKNFLDLAKSHKWLFELQNYRIPYPYPISQCILFDNFIIVCKSDTPFPD